MGTVANLLQGVAVPKMLPIEQHFDDTHIPVEEIPAIVKAEMEREKIKARFKPGMSVSITAGSRGINNIALIIKSIVDVLYDWGCKPFIVPAMGSHGGATPEGQAQMISGYGITEETMGCPIVSSMETVVCGHTELGGDVRMDKHAYESDAIVLVNRIKTHTAFRGPYESGLMKMMAIGLGKQPGAQIVHQNGFKEAHELIPRYGKVILHNSPVAFGMAILENAYDQTMELHALDKDEIEEEEPKLLIKSRPFMPRLLFDSCDVLIVDKIGKDIDYLVEIIPRHFDELKLGVRRGTFYKFTQTVDLFGYHVGFMTDIDHAVRLVFKYDHYIFKGFFRKKFNKCSCHVYVLSFCRMITDQV